MAQQTLERCFAPTTSVSANLASLGFSPQEQEELAHAIAAATSPQKEDLTGLTQRGKYFSNMLSHFSHCPTWQKLLS